MDGSRHRGRRIGTIALGVLAIVASVLWTLLSGFAVLWVLSSDIDDIDLSIALVLGAALALGIVTFLVGVFVLLGRFPGRRGWLVVGAVALAPFAPLIRQGLEAQEHVAAVNGVAEHAYTERSGLGSVTAECVWEYDIDESERWTCDMGPAAANDSCLVDITRRETGRINAAIYHCERDAFQVNGVVERAYRKRTGLAKVTADCDWYKAVGSELWLCDVGADVGSSYDRCAVAITRRDRGRISAHISDCRSDDP